MSADRLFSDLAESDVIAHPVWYFPRDESVDDELTVRPVIDPAVLGQDLEILIRTRFTTSQGTNHVGWVHWGRPSTVDYIRPVMFVRGVAIMFWHGIRRPNDAYLKKVAELLPFGSFPVIYETENMLGLEPLRGSLEGIYFLTKGRPDALIPNY